MASSGLGMVRLKLVGVRRLREPVTDAWRLRAGDATGLSP